MKHGLLFLFIGILTACSSNEIDNDLTQEIYSDAKYNYKQEDFVDEGYFIGPGPQFGLVENVEVIEQFYQNAKEGKQDILNMVFGTIEGDPIYKHIYFDGEKYQYVHDMTQDTYGVQEIFKTTCNDLQFVDSQKTPYDRFEGKVYLLTECDQGEGASVYIWGVPNKSKFKSGRPF